MSCLAITSDLIFGTKIRSTGASLGVATDVVHSMEAVGEAIRRNSPMLVLVDMNAGGTGDMIKRIKAESPGTEVVAYFSHVDKQSEQVARESGADCAWPRSRLSRELPHLMAHGRVED